MTFAFNYVRIGDFPEAAVGKLVVAPTEKLSEASAFSGLLGKILLIGAVKVTFPIQILFLNFDFIGIGTQWLCRNYMCKTLQHDGSKQCHDAGELDNMMPLLIHG